MPGNPLQIGKLVGSDKPIILPADARERHLYISGGTGVGKSKFLEDCIQQDILNWRDSHCGLILFDPHGLLYANLMSWLARHDLKGGRRIIPIELGRNDWVVSYNLLRKRAVGDASVTVSNFVEALAHVWGEGGTTPTPLFARWANIILLTLYQGGYTASDFIHLISRQDIRQAMVAKLLDPSARHAWEKARQNPKEFEQQTLSTTNRFHRLSGPKVMKATFGQPHVSLDLLESLNRGDIILVNLSTKGGMINEVDANTFATILLSDLWAAAQIRGKQEREEMRPFYVYIDECQKFITPTIAENLDQSRGFGLHLTLANQYPKKFINAGPHGQAMYDSIMANGGNKIVFKQEHPEDAKKLGEWLFMNTFDTDAIKHQLYSTKVMGTRTELRQSVTKGTSDTRGEGTGAGGGKFHGQSTGQGTGEAETVSTQEDGVEATARAAAWNQSFTDSSGESESWSKSYSQAHTESESITTSAVDVSIWGKELSSVQFRSIDEQIFRAMQKLFDQKDRHFAIRYHGGPKEPLFVVTPIVSPVSVRPQRVEDFRQKLLEKLPFALRMIEAEKNLEGRVQKLLTDRVEVVDPEEFESVARRIKKV